MNNQKFNSLLCKLISTKDPRRIGCSSISSLTNLIAKTTAVIALVVFSSSLVEAAPTCTPTTGSNVCGAGGCAANEVCVEVCNALGLCGGECRPSSLCVAPPQPANLEFTQILDESLSFLDLDQRKTNYSSVASLINLVSNVIVILAFAVSFATLAFNLIQLITSQGDPKKMEKVRRALFWSIIGMILALVVHALRSVVISMLSLGNVGFFQ